MSPPMFCAPTGPICCCCTSSAPTATSISTAPPPPRPTLLRLPVPCAAAPQHLYGPRSPEAYWAIEYIDGLIGQVLGALPGAALDSDTVVAEASGPGLPPVTRARRLTVHL